MATALKLDGLAQPIRVVRSRRARRITLSMSRATGIATLTVPMRMPMAEAEAFAQKHCNWLEKRAAAIPEGIPFTFGMDLPYRGDILQVEPSKARGVALDDDTLYIGASETALPLTLERWLKTQARTRLQARSTAHADALDVAFTRVCVRDTRSRWGSCSSNGTLSYSWRVIFAPDEVLNYLAAHEVCHLREMNHGPRFWGHVRDICPEFERWKDWLSTHGPELHRYGRP